MIEAARLTSKGQVTLPKKIRQFLEAEKGDTLIFELKGDVLVVRKARDVEGFFNTLKPLPKDYKKDLDQKIAKEVWNK